MARREEDWRRRREEEDAEEEKLSALKKTTAEESKGGSEGDKVRELIERSEPLIEQVNNLYNMFAAGIEKIPPIERRKQLDQTMSALMMMGKPTPALRFQAHNLQSKYTVFTERWDRLLKAIELGKKRRALKLKKKSTP